MEFDVVIVLYNNCAWLPNCLAALCAANYKQKLLHLFFVDNASRTDEAEIVLAQNAEILAGFASTQLIKNAKNLGFGAACNVGASAGNSDNILFLNVDTEVDSEVFNRLQSAISTADENTAAFECRQLPFETGHHINPVTMQTTWASAAALVVRRAAFVRAGGFDKHLFMYCEDVDLSWRLRALGYSIIYVPSAKVVHYSYLASPAGAYDFSVPAQAKFGNTNSVLHLPTEGGEMPSNAASVGARCTQTLKFGEYIGGLYGNLLLRYKFGRLKDIFAGHTLYLRTLRRPVHFANVRKVLAKNYLKHFAKLWPFLFWRIANRKTYKAHVAHFDGGFAPDRGAFALLPFAPKPLVSIVVRTCGRPDVLRKTLSCLKYQTYDNFEVIVVEDGAELSRQTVDETLTGLRYMYHCTGEHVGRGRAGNIGLDFARGEYCNLLDDDDYFYPDHLELLAGQLVANPETDLVTAASMALEVEVASREPYEFEIKDIYKIEFTRMDEFMLCQRCLMPIQSVMFKRDLFARYGGLHEELNGNEDWYMWLKFFAHARRINSGSVDVSRATSLFVVPANAATANKRLEGYREYDAELWQASGIEFTVTPKQMREYYNGMVQDMRHLRALGKLDEFLDELGGKK